MRWAFDTAGGIVSSVAIGDEGIIFVGSIDNHLYAIQPDGSKKWSFDAGADIRQASAIADDGTVYFGSQNNNIFALNPDGSLKWTFNPGNTGALSGELAIAADGTIYAGIGGGSNATVYAINPDGSEFWNYDPRTSTQGIALGLNGLIVITDSNGRVYGLNSQGVLQWEFDVTNGISSPVIFDEDGTFFYGSNSGFFAVNPDGSPKWSVNTSRIAESASIGVNGDIYVPVAESTTAGALLALNPADGSERWRFDTDTRVQTSPAVGFDGTIYFGTDAGKFFALRPDGSQRWVFEAGGDIQSSPTIAPDGTIYFGSDDSKLYALRSSSAGLAASSWPKKQRDVRNTGRLGSDVTRRRFFAPHVYWLDDENNAILTIHHTGGTGGTAAGTTAQFRIDVLNRDGSVKFSVDESVEPGETKNIVLSPPDSTPYAGSAVVDAPIKDGSVLAPFLTWQLDVSKVLKPLRIGVFFSDPTDAALVHRFPAEASSTNGLGIAVQNIGDNGISCGLEFFNADGSNQSEVPLNLSPLGSVVDFFNSSLPDGFMGSATLSCDAPVVAVSVNQDFANGGFPTDRVTVKGQ